MHTPSDGVRKAAILLRALDEPTAQLLWSRLSPAQAERVRKAQAELGELDPATERRILDEFLRLGLMQPKQSAAGLDLSTLAEHRRAVETGLSSAGSGGKPFGSLQHVEVESLVRALAGERAQTVALVLAHLPARQAAGVLQRLEPNLQKEVVQRLVRLEETTPDILQEVEAVLRARLAQEISIPRRQVAGLAALASILPALDLATRQRILAQVDDLDPALADRLAATRTLQIRFEDLIGLDAVSLRRLIMAADFEVVVLALTGADAVLVDRVLEVMPETDGRVLKKRLQQPGPIRLRDVEEARRRLAALADRLAQQGHIRLPVRTATAELPLAA
jgi:flagellar motor switch protein FliG